MDDKFDPSDTPLAQSSVTLQLEQIQRRCSQLLEDDSDVLELTLEEPVNVPNANDPYNQG
ncbi:MAG: hypothetical protein AAF351_06540 [Pseudomonadota bacterium]